MLRNVQVLLETMPQSARRHLRLLPGVVLLGLTSAALEGFGIGLVIPMLSIIMGVDGGQSASGLSARLQAVGAGMDDGTRLAVIAAAVFVLIALKNVVSFANVVLTAYIYGQAGHSVRRSLSERLVQVGFPFLRQQDPGRLLNIISNESWSVSDAVNAALSMVINASAALVLAILLFALSWQMTLLVGLGVGLISLFHAAIASKLRHHGRDVADRNSTLASRMLHVVQAGQLIRIFNMEVREQTAFEQASEAVRRAMLILQFRLSMLGPMTEVLYSGLFLCVVIGAWLAGLSFPVVVAFVVLLYRLQPYIRSVQGSWGQLQSQLGSIEEVRWLLDTRNGPAAPSGTQTEFTFKDRISFDGVAFAYQDATARADTMVLRGATFDIRAGKSTALVGRSGAGKTTIVNLLCRLVDPVAGTITVDGTPLNGIDPQSWRNIVALASQELELVDDSIVANILYGQDHATEADAMAAAQLVEAHDFIMELPDAYKTIVGHRGLNLSAGQRQRIALARALVRKPELLILDEATNAVDGLSETAILATIAARKGKGTTVLISHHKATISGCDDVVVLKDGTAVISLDHASAKDLSMEELYAIAAGVSAVRS